MSVSHQFSDQELLERLRQDDTDAFRYIYEHYWYKLYLVAYKRLRSKEASEEIVQNIFSRLWLNRQDAQIKGLLDAYLYTAVRYAVINHLEKEANRKNFVAFAYYRQAGADNSTEESVDLHDLESNIQKAIDLMPAKCQSVFVLSRQEYRTNREIAGLLHISEKTVENHITNALKTVRIVLRKTGVFCVGAEIMILFTLFVGTFPQSH